MGAKNKEEKREQRLKIEFDKISVSSLNSKKERRDWRKKGIC